MKSFSLPLSLVLGLACYDCRSIIAKLASVIQAYHYVAFFVGVAIGVVYRHCAPTQPPPPLQSLNFGDLLQACLNVRLHHIFYYSSLPGKSDHHLTTQIRLPPWKPE